MKKPFDIFLAELHNRADDCSFEERDRMTQGKIAYVTRTDSVSHSCVHRLIRIQIYVEGKRKCMKGKHLSNRGKRAMVAMDITISKVSVERQKCMQ